MDVLKNVRNRGGISPTNIQYTCMNCGKVISNTAGQGIYGRRFCCDTCKDEYMEKSKQTMERYSLYGAK